MKETKVRVWNKKEKRWYRGGAVQLTPLFGNSYGLSEPNAKIIELSHYTGLRDSNGTEIYEGDIMIERSVKFDRNFVVEWHNAGWAMNIGKLFDDGPDRYDPLHFNCASREVIGNIYENPELLEKAA